MSEPTFPDGAKVRWTGCADPHCPNRGEVVETFRHATGPMVIVRDEVRCPLRAARIGRLPIVEYWAKPADLEPA